MSLLEKYVYSDVYDKPPEFNIEGNILKGKIVPMDVPEEGLGHLILHHLTSNPDIIGQINVDDGRQYTFAEIRDLSVRCAKWLVEHNVKPGDIISVFSYNQSELFVPLLATLFVGAIFAPISYGITSKNVEYYLNLMEPKFIFVSEDSVELVAAAIKNANKKTELIVFGSAAGHYEFDDTIKCELTALDDFECARVSDISRTVFILFSSGTTGLSKGVEFSHEAIMKSLIRFEVWGSDFSRSLWYSSVSWISGVVMTLNAIIKGATKIFHRNFEPAKFCRIIEQYEVTYAILSPTMMYQLCKAGIVTNYAFPHLKTLATTGAKIRKSVIEYFVQSLPNICVHQCYGMTEVGGVMTFPSRDKNKKDSIGTVSYNVEIKVVDPETQQNVGANRLGELYFKSPFLMKGYYHNPEATCKTVNMATGWLQSGDRGFYDDEGFVFIVDRLKEILKVKSHHVSPVEIEHVLMQHPGVEEAVVVGVPHESDIDHPMAFVTKAPGGQVTKEELLELAASIGDFHRLRAGVVFLDKMPQTASMKIDRKKLRELAKSYAKI